MAVRNRESGTWLLDHRALGQRLHPDSVIFHLDGFVPQAASIRLSFESFVSRPVEFAIHARRKRATASSDVIAFPKRRELPHTGDYLVQFA